MIVIKFQRSTAKRKYTPEYSKNAGSGKILKVIETLPMGNRRSIAIIQVADRHFLVAVTPNQINLLASLPKSLLINSETDNEKLSSQGTAGKENRSTFRQLYEIEKKRPAAVSGEALYKEGRI
jgi:flagellar biogenesis protein FliO